MIHAVNWNSYAGSSSYILAGVLLLATVVLTLVGVRFRQGKPGKGPGKFLGTLLISGFVLAILTFLEAVGAYGLADVQQGIHFTSTNPITPVTMSAAPELRPAYPFSGHETLKIHLFPVSRDVLHLRHLGSGWLRLSLYTFSDCYEHAL